MTKEKKSTTKNSKTKTNTKVSLSNSNIFKYWYHKLFKFTTYSQNLKIDNPESPINLNIYSCDGKVKDFVTKQNRIHKIMKYGILLPGIKLLNWILGKHLTHSVPDTQLVKNGLTVENKQYINLRMFDKCYDKSVKDWHDMYLCKSVGSDCSSGSELNNAHLKNSSVQILLSFKKFMNTFICNDTAYIAFFDMLSYNYSKSMIDHYNGDVNHLLYNSTNINDIRYFILRGMVPQCNLDLVSKMVDGSLYVQEVEENAVEHIYHLTNGQNHYLGVVVQKPSGPETKGLIKPVITKDLQSKNANTKTKH